MTAQPPTPLNISKNLKRVRILATALVLCGVAQALLGVVVAMERPAVHITSYSKLVEMEHRDLLTVPTGDELSFARPKGDLWALHGELFPLSASTRTCIYLLSVLGVLTSALSALILFFTRRGTLSSE